MPQSHRDIASLAHDLNQLLWAIQGRARILATRLAGDSSAAAARIAADAGLAADLLAGRDAGSCELGAVSRAAWEQAVAFVSRGEAAAAWNLDVPDEPAWVAAPPGAMRRVLANLMTNALEAMPAGGAVTCTLERRDGRVIWRVGDSGPGIPADVRARLFTAGTTGGKTGGHGLGLAGARDLVRGAGGDLVHLPGPVGAVFEISLEPASPDDPSAPDHGLASTAARVLVVDDEATVRSMLDELLTIDGHTVTLAADHDSALAAFAADRYDAALIDLGLPGRSGTELAAALRRADPALAVVLLSGWGREEELAASDPAVDLTGIKPLDQPILRDLLARAVALTAGRRDPNPEA